MRVMLIWTWSKRNRICLIPIPDEVKSLIAWFIHWYCQNYLVIRYIYLFISHMRLKAIFEPSIMLGFGLDIQSRIAYTRFDWSARPYDLYERPNLSLTNWFGSRIFNGVKLLIAWFIYRFSQMTLSLDKYFFSSHMRLKAIFAPRLCLDLGLTFKVG